MEWDCHLPGTVLAKGSVLVFRGIGEKRGRLFCSSGCVFHVLHVEMKPVSCDGTCLQHKNELELLDLL